MPVLSFYPVPLPFLRDKRAWGGLPLLTGTVTYNLPVLVHLEVSYSLLVILSKFTSFLLS